MKPIVTVIALPSNNFKVTEAQVRGQLLMHALRDFPFAIDAQRIASAIGPLYSRIEGLPYARPAHLFDRHITELVEADLIDPFSHALTAEGYAIATGQVEPQTPDPKYWPTGADFLDLSLPGAR